MSNDTGRWKARAERNWQIEGVDIRVVQDTGYSRTLLSFPPHETLVITDPHVVNPEFVPLRLSDEAARAVYEALAEYFGGRPITVTDREDLMVERRRVDTLLGAVTSIALSGRPNAI